MQKTIEKIHRKFDTAGEKLLAKAKEIINAPLVKDAKKIERFKKIGFTAGKPIKDAEEMTKKQREAQDQIKAIEYYQVYYPSYKFISEAQIEKICKKYGLLYGESSNYLGDIPEKNLAEIEAFKLREEDYYKEEGIFSWINEYYSFALNRYRITDMIYEPSKTEQLPEIKTRKGIISAIEEGGNIINYPPKEEKKKPPFKICAPKKDFNTKGYEVKDGYKLVYDPIVIQPVKYKEIKGGLIISKWGLEGQDESLANEISN